MTAVPAMKVAMRAHFLRLAIIAPATIVVQLSLRELKAATFAPSGLLKIPRKMLAFANMRTTSDIVAVAATRGTSPPLGFRFAELAKCVATECDQSRSDEKLPERRQGVDDRLPILRELREVDVNRMLRYTETIVPLVDKPKIQGCHRIYPPRDCSA